MTILAWVLAVVGWLVAAFLLRTTMFWSRHFYMQRDEAARMVVALQQAEHEALSASDLKGVYVVPPDVIGEHGGDMRA